MTLALKVILAALAGIAVVAMAIRIAVALADADDGYDPDDGSLP